MKINPKEAILNAASNARSKAGEAGGKASDAASRAAKRAGETLDAGKRAAMLSIYNPVFPEDYAAADYDRPKMIVIADEDQRKGIEVCEGAIGWFSKEAGLEVLHLYEEAVPFSGVAFFPRAICDAVYFEDTMTPGRYVSLDCYFDVLNKDKITELRRIAYELGAKKCTLEVTEEAKSVRVGKGAASDKGKTEVSAGKARKRISSTGGEVKADLKNSKELEQRIVFEQEFEGNANPKRPELKWYAHDQEIEFLISTRCNGEEGNLTKKYRVNLDSSSSQTMSVSLAGKIDKALGKMGAVFNFSLSGEAKDEMRKSLMFEVEF